MKQNSIKDGWFVKKKIKKVEQVKCIKCGDNVYRGKYCNECKSTMVYTKSLDKQ